jgi:hypothetical protein
LAQFAARCDAARISVSRAPVFSLKPAGQTVRVVAFGDFGRGRPEQKQVANAILAEHRKKPFDFAQFTSHSTLNAPANLSQFAGWEGGEQRVRGSACPLPNLQIWLWHAEFSDTLGTAWGCHGSLYCFNVLATFSLTC